MLKMINSEYEKRLKSASVDLQHSKMKYIVYSCFSRGDVAHSYRYFASEINTKIPYSNEGSWDLVLVNTEKLRTGLLSLIFVEIKSQFSDSEKLISELSQKIQYTMELIEDGNGQVITDQLSPKNSRMLKIDKSSLEFAIFIPSIDETKLIDYIDSSQKEYSNQVGFVIWTLANVNSDRQAITIPYLKRGNVKICSNIMESSCKLCYCRHNDPALTRWFENSREQNIVGGGIMLPKLSQNWSDPVIAIISILISGRIFISHEKYLTSEDLINRIEDLYKNCNITVTSQEVKSYIDYMEKMRILIKDKQFPSRPYHLNSTVKELLNSRDRLLQDIVFRAVKRKISSNSGIF